MEKLNVAVVGVGHLGKEHARIYNSLADVQLKAVVDANAQRARAIGENEHVPFFYDHRELLTEGIDAVSVAVPTASHFEIANDFLKAGVSVLVEKPMTRTLDEADTLIRLAREKNKTLQVGHVERFNPIVSAIRDKLNRPRFIECHRLSPFSFRSVDIDVVMDVMIHDIDIILHLVPSPLARVDAVGVPVISGRVDIANARLVFEDNCVATVSASRVSDRSMRKIRIFSLDAYLSVDYMQKSARLFRKAAGFENSKNVLEKVDITTLKNPAEFFMKNMLSIEDIKIDGHEEPLKLELRSFVNAVKTRTEPEVPGEHGKRAIAAALQILESIEKNSR
ncbi:MAG: Gfo/Idh/MocA family oxidoreductase [Planctomycetota bacterium]|nr:Gfo/Idh/MocA family oxidoreductase [Planctomycetota bacterium]